MELNKSDIKNALMDAAVYVDNVDYATLLNMPVNDRDMLIKAYNKKVKKMNEKH
ncbi:hypothetical protein VWH97_07425 [Escherichia coli O157]|nr:hypothetical protein [Escherichia coli O157]USL83668.1 hypothetical protein A4_1 [Escherichia phage A4]